MDNTATLIDDLPVGALLAFESAIKLMGYRDISTDHVKMVLINLNNKSTDFKEDLYQLVSFLPFIFRICFDVFGTSSMRKISESGLTGREFIEKITKNLNERYAKHNRT